MAVGVLCAKATFLQDVPNAPEWSRMVSNGPEWSRMVPNGPEWSRMVPKCSNDFKANIANIANLDPSLIVRRHPLLDRPEKTLPPCVKLRGIDGTGFVDSAAGAPKELTIQFHNEMAYAAEFPKYVTFAMVKQANVDGTTTLADNMLVQQKLSASLLKKFHELGVQYIRFLHDESEKSAPDFYNSWQGAFQTSSMDVALQNGNNRTNFSILKKHDDRRLRHILWCPVFHQHPTLGELFFNSVLNRHGSWMDGHSFFGKLPNSERPYHCTWGDGSEFNDEELAEIRTAYSESTEYIRLNPGDVPSLNCWSVTISIWGPTIVGQFRINIFLERQDSTLARS